MTAQNARRRPVVTQPPAKKLSFLRPLVIAVAVIAVIAVLFVIFNKHNDGSSAGGSGQYVYQVGAPGPGQQAPDFTLPSTAGGQVSLASLRGKTVLTYWHEGLGCQPCWDQMKAIEADPSVLKAAGIDDFVAITSGPVDALSQQMSDSGLHSTLLADTDLAVSSNYHMNDYGMMGNSRDGHSFVLIGPTGKILWRADYGGAPNYTMFVPVATLLDQLKASRLR